MPDHIVEAVMQFNLPLVALLFVPQIRILLKQKNSEGISLLLLNGSFWFQFWGILDVINLGSTPHIFMYAISMFFLGITICLTVYYRIFPGGKKKGGE